MTTSTAQLIDETILAWDMYCTGDFSAVRNSFANSKNEEVQDIMVLANLEQKSAGTPVMLTDRSLFSPLVAAIAAYKGGDHQKASNLLGDWLLSKNFFSPAIMERFVESSEKIGNYDLMYRVALKYADWRKYDHVIARPLFSGAFGLGKHTEAIKIYNRYRNFLNGTSEIQKVGFSLIQLSRYKEAEKILLALYERETGKPYSVEFDSLKTRFQETIRQIPELEKSGSRSFEENWQLGMAYLVSEDYNKAMTVFKQIM
jgi:hypothetical protein